MKCVHLVWTGLCTALVACGGGITDPEAATAMVDRSAAVVDGETIALTGSGHHTRVVGGVAELTTFSFNAQSHQDGRVTGQYQYNFQANGFAIHGPVTCVTRLGNQVWVGGIVDRVVTDNPNFETLQGLEMWWRSTDNGEGADSPPDETTGVGFGFPGSTVTAASWCRDQKLTLVARPVEHGNIQVH